MSKLQTVDPSTITETPGFRILSRFENKLPKEVLRLRDNETFSVDDLVSNGTQMKGRIKSFSIYVREDDGGLDMYVDHTWSGVGMNLDSLYKLPMLPSEHQMGDPVLVYFVPDLELVKLNRLSVVPHKYSTKPHKLFKEIDNSMVPVETVERVALSGRIHAIHFLPGRIKYDIDMSFTGGANTRIYNIDSIFVFADKN